MVILNSHLDHFVKCGKNIRRKAEGGTEFGRIWREEYAIELEGRTFYQSQHWHIRLSEISRPALGIGPQHAGVSQIRAQKNISSPHMPPRAARQRGLKTISIVQFDCLNQTDLLQIHRSFDKSITVSFR